MRLKRHLPSDLNEEQLALYGEISGGRRADGKQHFPIVGQDGALEGPFNAMLLAPRVGSGLQRLGSSIRYESNLPPRLREIAILMVASRWNCDFERRAHEPIAADAGVSTVEMASIHENGSFHSIDPTEKVMLNTIWTILQAADLTDDEYGAAVDQVGPEIVFELLTLIGYYSTLALQLRIFRVE